MLYENFVKIKRSKEKLNVLRKEQKKKKVIDSSVIFFRRVHVNFIWPIHNILRSCFLKLKNNNTQCSTM